MLVIDKTEFKPGPWNFPPDLVQYREAILKLVGAPDAYRFASKQILVTALANPGQPVNYQYKIGNAGSPIAATKTLTEIFAEIDKKVAKNLYNKAQRDADSLATEVWNEALRNNKVTFASAECVYYYQGAYMSGDQFAVGAALVHDPKSRLILLYMESETAAAQKLVKFYTVSCKLTAARLLPVQVDNSKATCLKCGELVDSRINTSKPKPSMGPALSFMTSIPAGPRLFPVGGATSHVAECVMSTDQRGIIRKEWSFVDPNQNSYWTYRIDKFLREKGVSKGERYVILWIRFSGKEGGAHPELDDSWTGLGQVVHGLLKEARNVIVVGRPRGGKNIADKLKKHLDLLDESKGSVAREKLKIWGEYWKKESGELNRKIIGASRAAEYAIFLRMLHSDWGCKLVHVGMRSGAMDAASLLGMRTLFIENAGNEQIQRTTKWTGPDNNNAFYKRLDLGELPTWRARKLVHGKTEDDEVVRGYTETDLAKIVSGVHVALGY